jgi:Fe-Mn family superoxide dismutase
MNNYLELLPLPYSPDELEPFISRQQLSLHHDKHHAAYVNKANDLLRQIEATRQDGDDFDFNSIAKKMSFNFSGDTLHNLFWRNLQKSVWENRPYDKVISEIEANFGSFERFQSEFTELAISIEGSGWAALAFEAKTRRLILLVIQNHNLNYLASANFLLVLDMWEHAYYLDYKSDKSKYANNFWQLVNWKTVSERLEIFSLDAS